MAPTSTRRRRVHGDSRRRGGGGRRRRRRRSKARRMIGRNARKLTLEDKRRGVTRKEGSETEAEDEGTMDETDEKKKRSTKNSENWKKLGGGFNKPCCLSPQLQAVIGEAELAGYQEALGFTLGRRIYRRHRTSKI
ncbi:hypothetical protein MLD38_013805 [Melastoma candidum]|uniref:Uncharacterized protein n=1 Tax=Melastoma candidum TaxID=119954 RepID=A0ACB9RAQ7_9MYRT|nr:hypothetical protein MLD38_013805 [Melastoma candidum]